MEEKIEVLTNLVLDLAQKVKEQELRFSLMSCKNDDDLKMLEEEFSDCIDSLQEKLLR